MKIRNKIVLYFLSVAAVSLLAILTVVFYSTDTHYIKDAEDKLQAVASIQKSRVEEIISKDFDILNQITNRTGIVDALASYNQSANSQDLSSLKVRLEDAQNSVKNFEFITIYDSNQKLVVSSNPELKLEDFYDVHDLKSEYFENKIEINDKGEKKIILHGPVKKSGAILGTLVIVSKIGDYTNVTRDYTGLGQTGETVLAARNANGDAVFLGGARFGGENVVVLKEKTEVGITQALLQNETLLKGGVDYRNAPVYAVTKYIPETDWGLVVKMDKSEIDKPIYADAALFGGASLLVILIGIILSFWLANSIADPIQKLKSATEEVERGNLEARSKIDRRDEIGDLSNSFNHMTSSLKWSRENIEAKIGERTKELEKTNQAMVGRELKMIELKEEIKKLKQNKHA